jgi:hypothetical protein
MGGYRYGPEGGYEVHLHGQGKKKRVRGRRKESGEEEKSQGKKKRVRGRRKEL